MDKKPTYEKLEQRVKELEKEAVEQKRTAAALRDSEEKYRYLVENVNVGILVAQEMKLVFANTYIADTLGYTRDEIISNPNPFAFIYPDDQAMVIERHIKRIKGEEVRDRYPFRVVTAKGDVLWVEVTGVRINWEGEPATLNFLMDIMERKRIEKELEELYNIINRSPAVVFLWQNEADWPVEFVSKNVKEVFGYTAEEFKSGQVKYAKIIHPDDLERVIQEVTNFSQEKGRKRFTHEPYRIITKDREIKWLDDRTYIRRNKENDITHYQGIVLDITDRRRVEEALKENHDTLNSILSASPIGIGLVENRVLKWANEAMMNMFGFESEADFRDKNTKMLYAVEDDYHSMGRTMYDRLKSGMPAVDDVIFKRKDGSSFIGHVKMSCQDPSNPLEKAIFTVSDISWRKQAETERLQREKLEGVLEMAGAVCHELNQPLQSISGYSELLLMDMDDSHSLYAKIAKIKQQVNRMGEITSKLMGVTTYETKDYLSGKIIDINKSAK